MSRRVGIRVEEVHEFYSGGQEKTEFTWRFQRDDGLVLEIGDDATNEVIGQCVRLLMLLRRVDP